MTKAVVFMFGFQFILFLMWSLVVLFYLRRAGFYVAVAFVGCDDDAVWADLALGHLEGCRDGAIGKQTFSGAKRDRKYHELQFINKIIFEERLEQVRTSENVQIGPFGLFEFEHLFREIAAQKDISTETVRKHVRNIYEKLQVTTRMEAINKVYPKGN